MAATPGLAAGSAELPPPKTSCIEATGTLVERATTTRMPFDRRRSAKAGAAKGRCAPGAGGAWRSASGASWLGVRVSAGKVRPSAGSVATADGS